MDTALETVRLSELETVIEAGLKTFVDVGNALLEIRDSRLYLEGWNSFEDYCRERWSMGRNYANRLIASAEIVTNLVSLDTIPATEKHVRPLTSLEPDDQRIAWQTAVDTAPNGKITYDHVKSVVDAMRKPIEETFPQDYQISDMIPEPYQEPTIPRPHVSNNSGNNEWYTPAEYVEAARAVMGAIDTDPASCAEANAVVQAGTFFTMEDDGLAQMWTGRLWMNPPYAQPAISQFCDKLGAEYDMGNFEEGIVLVNNATETAWFRTLISRASAVVFPQSRIKFWQPSGDLGAPLQGQAVIYLGQNADAFLKEFSRFGWGAYCEL